MKNHLTENEKQLLKAQDNLEKVSRQYLFPNNPATINAQEKVKFWREKVEHERKVEMAKAMATKIDNSKKTTNVKTNCQNIGNKSTAIGCNNNFKKPKKK